MTDRSAPGTGLPAGLPLAAVEEVTAAALSPSTTKGRTNRMAAFTRFCEANGYCPLPACEQHVLRYLAMHRDRWGLRSATHHVDAIRAAHVAAGHPDPTAGKVRLYLAAVRHDKGVPKDTISPLLPADLAGADLTPAKREPALRSAVAADLARLGQVGAKELASLMAADLSAFAEAQPAAGPADRHDRRIGTRLKANIDALLAITNREFPLAGTGPTPSAREAGLIEELGRMAERAGLPGVVRFHPVPGVGLADDQHDWWVAWADPFLAQHVRNTAYVWVGLATAYRHQNFRQLTVADIFAHPDGYTLTLRKNKGPVPSGGHRNEVQHVHDSPDRDEDGCPACALRTWLRFRERAGIVDPVVFCRLMGGPGAFSLQGAWNIMKQVAASAGVDPERKIGTRAMRAGATTSLSANGASDAEIAEVTHHASYQVLAGYIRHLDPVSHQYHLPM